MTGSSGVGVTYAFETYSPISGGRCPVQMVIADRTLDPPGDFGSEHSDVLCARDQGWIMGWAETPQEALDNTLIYYRLGEDKRVALPQFNCQDGYFVSHIPGDVVVPEQSQVNEFLPPYKLDKPLDPLRPYGHGPQIYSDQGPVLELQRAIVMDKAKEIIPGIRMILNESLAESMIRLLKITTPIMLRYVCLSMGHMPIQHAMPLLI